jgi:DNA-binding response OmpR family regulator
MNNTDINTPFNIFKCIIDLLSFKNCFPNNDEKNINIKNFDLLTSAELNKFITNFNNILAMIINSIESLSIYIDREDTNNELFLKESIKNQLIACELMKMLINKLTLESNNLEPKIESVNVIDLVKKSGNTMNVLFSSTNIKYLVDIPKNIDITKNYLTDPTWLSLILMTFLINAKKYTAEGSITIKLDIFQNKLKVFVIDTGDGVKKEKILNLFKNKKSSESTANNIIYENNNLFLISKMTEKLNGTCGYKPNIFNNNKGSIFWIEIPSIVSYINKKIYIPDEITKKLKVIVCDDSKVMIEIFSNYIDKQIPNAKVYPTSNIRELLDTLEIIDEKSIIIIILDILLQNDNSLDHLQEIKNINPNVGIIIHTGSSMNDNEIYKYNNAVNLSLVIMHKPASLDIIKKNTTTILEIMGCYTVLIIDDNIVQSNMIKNFFESKSFSVLSTDNIYDARDYLFQMNGLPLIIIISKSISNILSDEIEQEFNYINSYKCLINIPENTHIKSKIVYNKIINEVNENNLDIILDNSIEKYCNS